MWLGWPSSVVRKFIDHQTDFDVNIDELSWIVAMMDLGNVMVPFFAGFLMDKMGRKLCTVILGPWFIISWLLTLYVPTPWALYTARLMGGIGKGMSYTVVPVFLGEIAGINIRGTLSSVFSFQLHLGFLLEAVVGPLVSYRTLNTMSAMVPVAYLLVVVWIPESPYYMLKKKRWVEAAECLQWYRGNDNIEAELKQMESNVTKEMENQATVRELVASRKNVRALMIVIMACACQRAGGISCLLSYSTLILPDPAPLMGKAEYIMLFAAVIVVVFFVGMILIDKVGRRPLLIISQGGSGVVSALFVVYFYSRKYTDVSSFIWLPYTCHVLFAVMYAIGVGFIPVVYLGEIFPVNIRSNCSAIASVTLAFCSFVTNKVFLFVSKNYGFDTMFGIFTVVNFIGAMYSYGYAIETKGKTFLEIQELLEKNVKRGKEKINQNNI